MNPVIISSNSHNCNVIKAYRLVRNDNRRTLFVESKIYSKKVIAVTNDKVTRAVSGINIYAFRISICLQDINSVTL